MLKKLSLCAIASISLSTVAFAATTNINSLFHLGSRDLTIHNDTDFPSTTALVTAGGNAICSTDLAKQGLIGQGATPAHQPNVVPSNSLAMLCGFGNCHAIIYVTQAGEPDCANNGGTAIADVQFSAQQGLVSNTSLSANFSLSMIDNDAFNLSIQSKK